MTIQHSRLEQLPNNWTVQCQGLSLSLRSLARSRRGKRKYDASFLLYIPVVFLGPVKPEEQEIATSYQHECILRNVNLG